MENASSGIVKRTGRIDTRVPVTRPTRRSLDDSSISKNGLIIVVSTKAIIRTMLLLAVGPTKAAMTLLSKCTKAVATTTTESADGRTRMAAIEPVRRKAHLRPRARLAHNRVGAPTHCRILEHHAAPKEMSNRCRSLGSGLLHIADAIPHSIVATLLAYLPAIGNSSRHPAAENYLCISP
jgi:hypothetical protein